MPRTLVLEEAKQSEVVRVLRALLTERGALLDEQTPARTVFEGLTSPGGFVRGGYVGVYQPLGEKGAEILVEAWAAGPRRVFWLTVGLELLAVLALVALSPGSQVWFLAAVVLWLWLAVAGLAYFLTLRGSRALEEDLSGALAQRFAAQWRVLDDEAQLERRLREKLEGELKEREVAAKPPPPPRFRGREKPPREERRPERKPGLFGRKAPRDDS